MTEANRMIYSQGAIQESRSTLISIVPFSINEYKPGLIPGQFHVDASVDEEPVCQVIGDSFFYVYIDKERGNLRVPAPSYQVARSICFDYNTAQLEAGPDCHPGLFYKQGVWTPEKVKAELQDELKYFQNVQRTWFVELVKRADDDWEKTRAHYAISDIQRYAARAIDPQNKMDKPWLIVIPDPEKEAAKLTEGHKYCEACGSLVPESAVICRFCTHILDHDKYVKMSFAAPKQQFDIGKVPGLRQ